MLNNSFIITYMEFSERRFGFWAAVPDIPVIMFYNISGRRVNGQREENQGPCLQPVYVHSLALHCRSQLIVMDICCNFPAQPASCLHCICPESA